MFGVTYRDDRGEDGHDAGETGGSADEVDDYYLISGGCGWI